MLGLLTKASRDGYNVESVDCWRKDIAGGLNKRAVRGLILRLLRDSLEFAPAPQPESELTELEPGVKILGLRAYISIDIIRTSFMMGKNKSLMKCLTNGYIYTYC